MTVYDRNILNLIPLLCLLTTGEEDMSKEEPQEKSSAPLPHFDVLRQEVEDDTMKVQEFLKGSFTYKVQERKNVSDFARKNSIKGKFFNMDLTPLNDQ